MNYFDLLFEEIIYRKHPEISDYDVVEEQTTDKRFLYRITIYLDMNMVDFNLSNDIIIEDYHIVNPEYDYDTSEHIYDMITTNVRDTVKNSVCLIGIESRMCIVDIVCQF